jgi:TP901-1 family phage major tail protein
MSAGAGKDYLLKIEDSNTPGTFTTIGGLRSIKLSAKADGIEKTNIGSAQWKELLDGAGIVSMSLSGSGVFTDSATEAQFQTDFLAQTLRKFRVLNNDNSHYWEGTFKITGMEKSSEYNGVIQWSISLESSGAVSYT